MINWRSWTQLRTPLEHNDSFIIDDQRKVNFFIEYFCSIANIDDQNIEILEFTCSTKQSLLLSSLHPTK